MDWSVSHVLSFEDNLTKLVNNDFALALENAWWDKLMSERPIGSRQETMEFLLTTADIHLLDDGQMKYDELVRSFMVLKSKDRGTGLKIRRNDFEDDRLESAQDWAAQAGAAMALAPQYQAADLLLAGETGLAYDGVAFFAATHPVNPFDPAKGNYSNLLPANPLVDSNGEVILANFNAAEAQMRSFSMPNGRNRNLAPTFLVVPPSLKQAGLQITQARVIKATENVNDQDFVAKWNGKSHTGVELIVINELEVAPSDWYVGTSNGGTAGLLPFIYGLRRAYNINSYNGITNVELGLRNELEWQVRGRNDAIYGHPYTMVKSKG